MSGTRWSKFYWSDWAADPALRVCSLAARGLWMEMLCVAAEHDPPGYVALRDRPLTPADLARSAGVDPATAETLVGELEEAGVFSRDKRGCIYSRRMIADYKKAETARRLNGQTTTEPKPRPAALKRRDNPSKVKAVWQACGGKCSICGVAMNYEHRNRPDDFEVAYRGGPPGGSAGGSAGGSVPGGYQGVYQGVCKTCNLSEARSRSTCKRISASCSPPAEPPGSPPPGPRAWNPESRVQKTESRVVESSSTTAHATASPVPNGHDLEPTRRHGTAPDLDSDLAEGAGAGGGEELERRLRQAAGIEHAAVPWPADLRPIYGLIGDGYDLDRDILPALRGMVDRAGRARSWGYFERAIREHAPAKTGPPECAATPPLSEAAKAAMTARVFVDWDTPAWDAWRRHYSAEGKPMPSPISRQHDHRNGWYFPTEWPPDTAGKEQAA